MVVIQIKKADNDQWLYETTCQTKNNDLLAELVWIHNCRIRIKQLIGACGDLANYGPMKPLDKQGIDHIHEEYEKLTIDKNEYYQADPQVRKGNREVTHDQSPD